METERTESAGVMYLLRRRGGPTVNVAQAVRGRFRWAGEYRQRGGGWGPIETARHFTRAERDSAVIGTGSEWVTVYVEVKA